MSHKLDKLDLKIVDRLQNNARISISELAQEVNASRQTVMNRLNRLLREDLITLKGGLNLKKFGFKTAYVGLEVKTDEARTSLLALLKDCPRILSFHRVAEKANLVAFLWGEDEKTLSSTIESFHRFQDVEIVYIHLLDAQILGEIIINVFSERKEISPCGRKCQECQRYKNQWCLGCPVVREYRSPL